MELAENSMSVSDAGNDADDTSDHSDSNGQYVSSKINPDTSRVQSSGQLLI